MYLGEELLPFNILLHNKAIPKVIGNWFCTPIVFKILWKPGFNQKNLIVTEYFLFVKKDWMDYKRLLVKKLFHGKLYKFWREVLLAILYIFFNFCFYPFPVLVSLKFVKDEALSVSLLLHKKYEKQYIKS